MLLACTTLGFTLSVPAGYAAQAAFALIFGAANGGVSTALWSSFAEVTTGQRRTTTAFALALLTAASKLGLAVAGLAIATWLSVVDYRINGAGLSVAMTGFPVAGAIMAFLVMALSGDRDSGDVTDSPHARPPSRFATRLRNL